jgi:hypothetical protein
MKFTLVDTKTGETATKSGVSVFDLSENNWSCDCNRGGVFGHDTRGEEEQAWLDGGCEGEEPETGRCLGENRYIVVGFEFEPKDNDGRDLSAYTLDEFNEGYPEEVRQLGYKMWASRRHKIITPTHKLASDGSVVRPTTWWGQLKGYLKF